MEFFPQKILRMWALGGPTTIIKQKKKKCHRLKRFLDGCKCFFIKKTLRVLLNDIIFLYVYFSCELFFSLDNMVMVYSNLEL